MVTFASILLAGSAASGVFAAPRPNQGATLKKRSTANGQGTGNDGFFWSSWSDGTDEMTFTNGDDGQYSVAWSGEGDIVVGKGWETGSAQDITYSGTYNPDGGSFLSVYGWFTNPLTEYYILEDFGTADPAYGITHVGNVTSDGSLYQLYQTERVNAASIQGTTNFHQYWSIRQDKRVGGTITTANHFNAWKAAGLEIGTFNYQIIATEGISGSGNSSITISKSGATDASSSAAPSSVATSSSSAIDSATSSSVAAASTVVSSAASSVTLPATSSQASPTTTITSPDASTSAMSVDSSSSISQALPQQTQGTGAQHHHHPQGTGAPFFHPNGTGSPFFHHHGHHHHFHSPEVQPTASQTSCVEVTVTSTVFAPQATGEPDDEC